MTRAAAAKKASVVRTIIAEFLSSSEIAAVNGLRELGGERARGHLISAFETGEKRGSRKAAEIAMSEVSPISDIRSTDTYRRRMTGVLLKRGIASCVNGAE